MILGMVGKGLSQDKQPSGKVRFLSGPLYARLHGAYHSVSAMSPSSAGLVAMEHGGNWSWGCDRHTVCHKPIDHGEFAGLRPKTKNLE